MTKSKKSRRSAHFTERLNQEKNVDFQVRSRRRLAHANSTQWRVRKTEYRFGSEMVRGLTERERKKPNFAEIAILQEETW